MADAFDTLIAAAVLAPSGDNTQPWEFIVNRSASTIEVCVDESRDRSPMNAGQRMARIACGAAIENIVQTAAFNGWSAVFERDTDRQSTGLVTLSGVEQSAQGVIEAAIRDRCTNRNLYEQCDVPDREMKEIKKRIAPIDGVSARWIVDRNSVRRAAKSIGDADAAMFGDRRFLLAFLENVRSDLHAHAVTEEGLPVGSLGLSVTERFMLPWLGTLSASRLVRVALRRAFKGKAISLTDSSAGLCVISSSSEGNEFDVAVGRMMQRVWLELTRLGYQVQPMMSLPVLQGFAEWNARTCTEPSINVQTNCLDQAAEELYGAAAILRFGKASPVTIRPGRRSRVSGRVMETELPAPYALVEEPYASV